MLEGILTGLQAAFTIEAILLVVLGCIVGSFIGMVPGLGPMQVIAIMIPIAVGLGDPAVAMIMLAGVYYGAVFGGSTSSILINAPGVASTVATSFDGYPMARKGLAGKALTIAAISSFSGGVIGAIMLTIAAKPLADVALLFTSPEYFAVMVLGMTAVAAFGERGRAYKAVLMLIFGMVLASIGEGSMFANKPRFTFGYVPIQDGISAITLIMGLFALPEAFFLILDKNRGRLKGDGKEKQIKEMRINRQEARIMAPVIGRQSVFGFLIGVMPGAGATIASLMGYAVERNLAPKEERDEFGKGSVRGLCAPETANNAASTGSFVPMLTLGIPGSGTTAILLVALISLGVTPGPALINENPQIFWGIIISMFFGNVVLLILNYPLIPYIAKLLTVPRTYLIPFVIFFSMVGAYLTSQNSAELFTMIILGVITTILRLAKFPIAPIVIGFILGIPLEDNMGRALMDPDYTGFSFIWQRPMTLAFLSLSALMLLYPLVEGQLAKRERSQVANKTVNQD